MRFKIQVIQSLKFSHIIKESMQFILLLLSFLLIGCASNLSNKTAFIQKSSYTVTAGLIESPPPEEEPLTETRAMDEMIAQAEYFCTLEEYKQADSVLQEVSNILNQTNIDSLPPELQDRYNEFYNIVLTTYSELLPTIYIPEEISLQIEKQKLLLSLDSIVFSETDSILPTILKSIAETKFDIPIAFNERVEKACMFYLRRNPKTIKRWLTRSAVYIPIIKKMFADSGLPLDLAYLPLIESAFNPKAYSRAHASGIWQFIPSTGKIYGLRNNYWLDERRDPLKATASAISYLKKLYNEFGHWYLALGAYNCGEGGMGRAISRAGVSDYWKLKLPRETMNYVPLYLASLIIIKNSQRFGFEPEDSTKAVYTDIITLSDCLDMNDIAQGIGVDKDTLIKLNPHILHWCTPPDMSDVRLYLPEGSAPHFNEFYAKIPDEKKVKWYRYRIRSGDNLLNIARHFKVSVEGIKTVNRMRSNRIIAGRHLFIPIPVNQKVPSEKITTQVVQKTGKTTKITPSGSLINYKVKKGDTLWDIADLFGVSVTSICQWNGFTAKHVIKVNEVLKIYQASQNPTPKVVSGSLSNYKVKKGDTPYAIAKMFNMTLDQLIAINGLNAKKPKLYAGDLIKVTSQKNSTLKASFGNITALNKSNPVQYTVKKGDNLYKIAQNFNTQVSSIRALNKLNSVSTIRIGDILLIPTNKKPDDLVAHYDTRKLVLYEVKRGDNLWSIASLFGVSIKELYAINNLNSNSVLMPGDVIKVSKSEDL